MKNLLFILAFFLFANNTIAQYIVDGNRYNRPTSNGSAIFTYTNCTTDSAGTLTAGTVISGSGVTQTIRVNVTNAGSYNLLATANGATFAGIGTLALGTQDIVLTATGTPLATGATNFTINTTPSCTFSRTIIAPNASANGTAIVSSYTCNTASTGNLIIGTPAFGVTQTITAQVTTAGSYVISAVANGVTFAGSGTVAIGTQTIVLTATGTPAALGTHNFTLNTTPNCTFSRETFGQVLVSGAATGNIRYATLAAAFTAINGGVQTGRTITISVEGNTNESTTSASLNAGTWTSITITPVGPRTIIGATVAGSALINLNGADNVTINGLNTGGNSLTIANTTVSATVGTSTIRFINDASNNTLTNCILSGSSTSTTSGIICFSTGTTIGNDNNTISNCTITPAGSNLPVNAIYSAGSSTVIDNSGNTISNNTIQDYFSPTLSSAGILLASNSAAWTITNNKLFQTATRTVSAGRLTIRGIAVITASAGGYIINNNIIGFANAAGTGTTIYNGAFTTLYRGIELTANTTVSNIQGNTVAGINFTTASTTNTTSGIFSGIAVNSGAINIGTTAANTIGSGATANALVINKTVSAASRITGIYVASAGANSAIQNNSIGGFSTGTGATFGYNFIGIATAGTLGDFTIGNNSIGSTTLANSITMGDSNTTTGVCTINGINNAATGTIGIDNNTFANTAVFGAGASTISGIVNTGGINKAVTINTNLIVNASVKGTGGTNIGISNSIAATTLSISNNTIRNFIINNTTGLFTAIVNSGAVTSSIAIDTNKLGDATAGLVTYTVANSGVFIGISNSGTNAAASLSIQNNDIRGIVHSVAATHAHTYIINAAATLSQNISGNTFTNLAVNTTGAVTFISNNVSLPANGVQTISNNSIVTGYAKTSGSGNVAVFTTAANSNASATITNTGNNFSNITVSGTSALTGWSQLDAGLTTKTVTNNTFSNWIGVTGATIVMTVNGFGNTSAITDNTVSNITSQAAITGLTIGTLGDATALNVNGNSITGLSSTGTGGAVIGLNSANNSSAINIFNNPINNLSTSGATASVTGLNVTGGTGTVSVYANTLYKITGTGASFSTANGIRLSGSTLNTVMVFKNKIYDIAENGVSTGALVSGLIIFGGLNVTCYNNLIFDLKAPNVSGTAPVRGLAIQSTVPNSSYKLYYNTIYLDATSTGVNFGAWSLYQSGNATASTANLTLNNNIIINNSVAKGTGTTYAFFRSSVDLENYNVSSNNNLFYAGIPSATNLLFGAGSDYLTLTDLQGFVFPRESNSVTENTVFLSTSPSNINYLKPDTTVENLVESGGVNIAGFTSDYADTVRQGNVGSTSTGTAPDLGAFEQEGLATTYKPIVVSGATIGNGNYATLGSAFMAINQGAQTGSNINISINGNTDEITGTAQLNAGTWNSLTITPNGNRTISGAMVPGSQLINLNGADNVTIDGLNTNGNSLTLINTAVSVSSGSASIRFINDASNNTITNCTISSSNTSNVIFFSTGTITGNDSNTISNCAIKPAGGNLIGSAIYSVGTSIAIDNSGNTIHNNTIQDYNVQGIDLESNSAAWTITYNKLFQTQIRTVNFGSILRGMMINTPSGGGYTINFNTIGFADDSGTGYTTYDGVDFNSYRGISLTANTTTSNIQGNTIAGINITKSRDVPVSSSGVFVGIQVNAGAANVGNITANTIGSSTVLNSIVINNSTVQSIKIFGIYVSSASATSAIQNNIIGGFSTGTSATSGYDFSGIRSEGALGNFTIRNNTIGSTTIANSIAMGFSGTSGYCTSRGILNNATGTISIDSNTIANISLFGTTGSTLFTGVDNTGGSTVTINNNLVDGITIAGTGGSELGLSNSAAATSLQINNNTLRGFSVSNTTAGFTAIRNLGAVTSSIAINDNKLGDATASLVHYTAANSVNLRPIWNTAGTSAATLSIQNNDIRGIVHSVAGSSLHFYITNSAATLSQNITGNTFTNLNVNTTGAVTFISNNVALPSGGVQNINNNSIVTGYAKTGATGDVAIFSTSATSNSNATITNSGNDFSNITVSGTGYLRGWNNLDLGGCTKTISNNVFRNWTAGTQIWVMDVADAGINKTNIFNNTVDNIVSVNGEMRGIYLRSYAGVLNCYGNSITNLSCSTTTTSSRLEPLRFQTFLSGTSDLPTNINNNTINNIYHAGGNGENSTRCIAVFGTTPETPRVISIYNNTISNITTDGTGNHSLSGLYLEDANNGNVYRNKIYNIAATAVSSPTEVTVRGISVIMNVGNNWNIYNNLVADLRAPNTANTNTGVVGLLIPNGSGGLCNFYYNTINLNASSTGSDFGTAGVYHGDGKSVLDMRNNIIVNNSTATGTGKTTVLMRSPSGTLYGTTYSSVSNNNLFYAGVPSVSNNLLSPDGSIITQTLAELQTNLAPRESNTRSGAVSFLSLDGTSSDFLRPDFTNTATSALISDKGTPISSVTADFAGVTRGSIPDIGAYEFFGTTSGVVSAYACNIDSAGTMTVGTPVSGVTQTITATVTAVGTYSIFTTTANGVTFSGTGTFAGTGAQDIVLTATGTPIAAGDFTFTLNTTPSCSFSRTVVTLVDVKNLTSGKTWLDRNLGASQVAISSTDANAYGDLYQWGRLNDGHQSRTSTTASTLSSTDVPSDTSFILSSSDWRSTANNNLWQGLNGTNNPCPTGYRVPTANEFEAERLTFSSKDANGAFNSILKFSQVGARNGTTGSLMNVQFYGSYWTSTVSAGAPFRMDINDGLGNGPSWSTGPNGNKAEGYAVRCIKGDETSGGTAVVSAYTCGAGSGTLYVGFAATGVSQTITANVSTLGTYDISATANGVIFSAKGTFAGTGNQTITLTAKGIPTYGNTYNFMLNTNPSCTFTRTSSSNASTNGDAVVSAYTCTTASAGMLSAGVQVSGVTQTITAMVTMVGNYSISTTANGITFAANGTFASTGNQDIVLNATGTPTTTGTDTFTLNTNPTCNFDRTTNQGSTNGTAVVSSYDCSTASAGSITAGVVVSGVTQTITATVTTIGTYDLSTSSYGVTFSASGSFSATGPKTIVLNATGTPIGTGTFTLNTTPNCYFTRPVATSVVDVTNPNTGRIWMDRNLGAAQAATSSSDANGFGDFYQWGRLTDGHQSPTSYKTSTLSSTDVPGNASFITATTPYDWRSTKNDNLWQGLDGTNNPCPSGYRLPTTAELDAERISWGNPYSGDMAINSPLKVPLSGSRSEPSYNVVNVGSGGSYWTSTVNGTKADVMNMGTGYSAFNSEPLGFRANAFSVRCIKGNESSGGTAVVSAYDCSTASSGKLIVGSAASGVTQTITATVTTVGTYEIITTTLNGVYFSGTGTFSGTGSQTITLTATGTPAAVGSNTYVLGTSPSCSFSRYASVTGVYASVNGTIKDFGTHNLGANTALDSFTYAVGNADGSGGTLGYLYQWGRQTDGHELRNSVTRSGPLAAPVANRFITNVVSPNDWLTTQSNTLWGDGTAGTNPAKATNDPCPTGFKVPSQTQWGGLFRGGATSGAPGTATINTWTWTGNGYTIGSNLYLPAAGYRDVTNATVSNTGTLGFYWSSNVNAANARSIYFDSSIVNPGANNIRGNGYSIRCISE